LPTELCSIFRFNFKLRKEIQKRRRQKNKKETIKQKLAENPPKLEKAKQKLASKIGQKTKKTKAESKTCGKRQAKAGEAEKRTPRLTKKENKIKSMMDPQGQKSPAAPRHERRPSPPSPMLPLPLPLLPPNFPAHLRAMRKHSVSAQLTRTARRFSTVIAPQLTKLEPVPALQRHQRLRIRIGDIQKLNEAIKQYVLHNGRLFDPVEFEVRAEEDGEETLLLTAQFYAEEVGTILAFLDHFGIP